MSLESPINRDEFIQHVKTRLSVLDINITPDQEKICVQRAKKKFLEYHQASTEKMLIGYKIKQEDIDRRYFMTPDDVYEVNNVLSYRAAVSLSSTLLSSMDTAYSFYDGGYQFFNGVLRGTSPFDTYDSPLVSYFLAKGVASLYNGHFNRDDLFSWSPTTRRLQIIGNNRLKVDHWLVLEVDMSLENEPAFWQNEWFIQYTVAVFKETWGENLSKFGNVELAGGMTIRGPEMRQEAKDEIKDLEDELFNEHANYRMIYVS